MEPSRLFGATYEQMQKFRDGAGGLGGLGAAKLGDFQAEIPRGTLRRPAPIIWYHSQPSKPKSNHVR